MSDHPWTGLSQEDLNEAIECSPENGHVVLSTRRGINLCICGDYYRGYDGKLSPTPDWSDYADPIDPRDYR